MELCKFKTKDGPVKFYTGPGRCNANKGAKSRPKTTTKPNSKSKPVDINDIQLHFFVI